MWYKNLNTGNRLLPWDENFSDNKKWNLFFLKFLSHVLVGESQGHLKKITYEKIFEIFFSKIMLSVNFFLKNIFSCKKKIFFEKARKNMGRGGHLNLDSFLWCRRCYVHTGRSRNTKCPDDDDDDDDDDDIVSHFRHFYL